MDLLSTSLVCVLLPFAAMLITAHLGLFNHVDLNIGLEHYAEHIWMPVFPYMPLNTLVNFGYIGLGLHWIGITQAATGQGVLKDKDSALLYTFNIMATLYGVVQLLRITTQGVLWSVLDQWCTLPFFSLLLVWGLYFRYGWSSNRTLLIMGFSLLSYTLTLFLRKGFDICLGLHVIIALCGAIIAYKKHPAAECLSSFGLALLSCLGFVVLKLADHHLAELCVIFTYISGHFLSKVCDIYQIYFVNNFFLDLTLQKSADASVVEQRKYFQHCETDGFYERQLSNDILYELPLSKKEM